MKAVLQAFEKIIILHLSETISEADVAELETRFPKLVADGGVLVVELSRSTIMPGHFARLLLAREHLKLKRSRLCFLHPQLAQSDAKSLSEAMALVNTIESNRVLEIFETSAQLAKARAELRELHAALSNALRSGLGFPESADPLGPDELSIYRVKVKEHIKRVQYLHRVLGTEIAASRKQAKDAAAAPPPAPTPEELALITERKTALEQARARAVAALGKAGILR